jgi:hypothetical protein
VASFFLLLHAAQLHPLRAPHLLESTHRPGTRCDNGQNGQTNRVPCAFGILSTITAQPGLHSRYSNCGASGTSFEANLHRRLGLRAAELRFRARVAPGAAHVCAFVAWSLRRDDRVAVIE